MDVDKISTFIKNLSNKTIDIQPKKEASYVMRWYLFIGIFYILFSDMIVNALVKNTDVMAFIQTIKGWGFVILTGLYIYSLVYRRLKLLKIAADEVQEGYESLASMEVELLKKEDKIFELSHYDRMSGLLNWSGLHVAFDELLNQEMVSHKAFLYIDIDNIKHVNDTLGHEKGNLIIKKFAETLTNLAMKDDIVARVSGDEFALVIPYDGDREKLHTRINKIRKHLQTTWRFDRYEFRISSSIGVAIFPDDGETLEEIMKNADAAMFMAKGNGRNQHYFYDEKISKKTENYVEMVTQIRYGISQDEFLLYYQPIVDLKSGALKAVEALIRWNHPIKGLLTPYHFIEIAEESGQINEIGKWVFDSACKQCSVWRHEDFKVSINMSGRRLFSENLIDDMKASIKRYEVDTKRLQIEITETAVMENLSEAIEILNEIHGLGITIALDDFGTGYSSLTYLQRFPIQVLKIDKAFIDSIAVKGREKENKIIDATIYLAHSLNLEIVAEGIENKYQVDYLVDKGCDLGQGYHYDKPMIAEKLLETYGKSQV